MFDQSILFVFDQSILFVFDQSILFVFDQSILFVFDQSILFVFDQSILFVFDQSILFVFDQSILFVFDQSILFENFFIYTIRVLKCQWTLWFSLPKCTLRSGIEMSNEYKIKCWTWASLCQSLDWKVMLTGWGFTVHVYCDISRTMIAPCVQYLGE